LAEPGGPAGGPSLDELVRAVSVEGEGDEYRADPGVFGESRVFGGLVVAQALHAALRTVDPDRSLHSLHGYFLRPSPPGAPVDLHVARWRDGRSFSSRGVTATVDGAVTFELACSCHVAEDGETYEPPVLAGVPGPDDLAFSGQDWPFDVRDLGPGPPADDGTRSTRRVWLRTVERLPDDPALHAALLAFMSDMTGSSFRPASLEEFGRHTDASLDHALWCHRPLRVDEWIYYDLRPLVSLGGRSTVRGLLYGPDGRLGASMAQELLIRRLDEPRPLGPADRA